VTRPGERTVLGFDYGTRRIGVAVGQEFTSTANPLVTLTSVQNRPDWDAIERLIKEWKPDALVIGVPYHMDGTAHEMTEAAKRFGRQLAGRFELPVHEADERLSSDEAERRTGAHKRQSKGDIDRVAAQVILEGWLRQQQEQGHG
jgi:putative Holliday junction resolvase